jgi:sirohydrochlorin ferrochelatase
MTAAARKVNGSARPIDALAAFIARAEARALLWQTGEIDLHAAIDLLQLAAERDGLVDQLGQDRVQQLMAEAFADEPGFAEAAWSAPSWHEAAAEYREKRGGHTLVVEIEPERLDRLRGLLADEVSIERAYADVSKPPGIPDSTLQAAEFLMQQKDAARMRFWLDRHSASERQAILRYLEQRKGTRAQ